jgi:hypothetical protein
MARKKGSVSTVGDLNRKANPRNPRVITDDQKRMLRKALDTLGDLGGIVYNRATDTLVGGHQRVAEFEAMDGRAPLQITNRYPQPTRNGTVAEGYVLLNGERFAYREVHWDRNTEAAAMIAANQHGGDFEWQQVSELLKELDGKLDLELTGLPQHELDNLLKSEWTPAAVEPLPGPGEGGEIDKVFLSKVGRKALDHAKVILGEPDDGEAVAKVCQFYIEAQKTPDAEATGG